MKNTHLCHRFFLNSLKIFFLLPVIATIYSCGNKELESAGTAEDGLRAAVTNRVSIPQGVSVALEQVRASTEALSERIEIVDERLKPDAGTLSVTPEAIDFNDISEKLAEQRKMIRELNRQLQIAARLTHEMQDSINVLNKLILDKNLKLLYMKENSEAQDVHLKELQENVYYLFIENLFKSAENEELKDEAQTVYYTLGTIEELSDMGVVNKSSNILKEGKWKISETKDPANFIRMNSETSFIPIYTRKIKLLSSHPENSFKIIKENDFVEAIEITDPSRFWSTTKYLIIVTGD